MRHAQLAPNARVRVTTRTELRLSANLASAVGSGWVRSGSALARLGRRLALIQDDALWLAWLDHNGVLQAESLIADPSSARVTALPPNRLQRLPLALPASSAASDDTSALT